MILLDFKNVQNTNTILHFLDTKTLPSFGDKYLINKCEFMYVKGLDNNISSSDIITIAITSLSSVSLNLIANYIYDFLKKNKDLTIIIGKEDLSNKTIDKIVKILKKQKKRERD